MHEESWNRSGGCRCGRVRFRTRAPPVITMACHCTGCQKMSASAFSLSLLLPSDGFTLAQGEPVIGGLHGPTRHFFCPSCMSWMFTRPEGLEGFVNLRPTMLDDSGGCAPFVETMTRERLPWARTPAVHSFTGFPTMSDFPALIEAYRTWDAPE